MQIIILSTNITDQRLMRYEKTLMDRALGEKGVQKKNISLGPTFQLPNVISISIFIEWKNSISHCPITYPYHIPYHIYYKMYVYTDIRNIFSNLNPTKYSSYLKFKIEWMSSQIFSCSRFYLHMHLFIWLYSWKRTCWDALTELMCLVDKYNSIIE